MNATNNTTSRTETILVVEDDKAVRDGLVMNLQLQGYKVISAEDGDEGMQLAHEGDPDLVLLDIMLPGWSGLDILTSLREKDSAVPVLIISARDKMEHKIEGLELGADDYVAKPFELPELLARVDALLRRNRVNQKEEPTLVVGDIEIDPLNRLVRVRGESVELSLKEYELLLLLAKAPGRPFQRETILKSVWGWDFDGTTRTVDNFIVSLRQKIEADPSSPQHIITVRQVGYKLEK